MEVRDSWSQNEVSAGLLAANREHLVAYFRSFLPFALPFLAAIAHP